MKFHLLEYTVSNRTVRIYCIVELCGGEKYWRISHAFWYNPFLWLNQIIIIIMCEATIYILEPYIKEHS